MQTTDELFMHDAIQLSVEGMQAGKGGTFGCVIVKYGNIVGKGYNSVLATNDPTAHAEITAIRDACNNLGTHQLSGCIVYSSCEPCPMCMGAIYWARIDKVYFVNTREDAANIGFDDSLIYKEISLPLSQRRIPFIQMQNPLAKTSFDRWLDNPNKKVY